MSATLRAWIFALLTCLALALSWRTAAACPSGSFFCKAPTGTMTCCDSLTYTACCNGECNECPCGQTSCNGTCMPDSLCCNGQLCDTTAGYTCCGGTCYAPGQCGSCTDNTCCSTACNGPCEACKSAFTGMPDGVCAPIPKGTDPRNECADSGALCQQDGACDGAGACELYPQSSGCSPNPCTSWQQCASGACLDGYCCDNLNCDQQPCMACSNAATGLQNGVCGPVKAGMQAPRSAPPNNMACPTTGTGSCSAVGVCDGSGNCKNPNIGLSCGPSACTSIDQVTGSVCDLSATCQPNTTFSCSPYTCNGTACRTSCTTSNDCDSTYVCVGGQCVKPLAQGAQCTDGSQCASGFCADGVCCNSGCGGTCEACTNALKHYGVDGACEPVSAGVSEAACVQNGACGPDGTCDGAGQCRQAQAGTPCGGTTTCVDANTVTGMVCNGQGSCVNEPGGIACAPYHCVNGACASSCVTDGDCTAPYFCGPGGKCTLPQLVGAPCSAANQCGSGACVDGICCDMACNTTCYACTKAKKGYGTDGACEPIASGHVPANAGDCTPSASQPCANTGACNGSGACQLTAPGTPCGTSTCVGNSVTGLVCDGLGACKDTTGTGMNCSPYVCDKTLGQCTSSCATSADCVSGAVCFKGECKIPGDVGTTCSAAVECTTNFCVEGVCCDQACSGSCESCKVAGSVGTCTPIAKGASPPSGKAPCAGTGTCAGSCDGVSGSCNYPSLKQDCGTACSGDVSTAKTCDGKGTCVSGDSTPCAPYACDAAGKTCNAKCSADADCSAGAKCDLAKGACAVVSDTCADPFDVKAPDGTVTSCNGYRCMLGMCEQTCAAASDCAPGYACVAPVCVKMAGTGGAGGSSGVGGTGGASASAGKGGTAGTNASGGKPGSATAGGGSGGQATSGAAPAAAGDPGSNGGCGCVIAGREGGPDGAIASVLVALAIAARRRRERRLQ